MAWSLRASSSAGGAIGGNLTIDKPTGTVDNDLMVISFYTETSGRITTLAGWTKVGESGPSVGNATYCTTYFKRASGEGSSYTWTLSGSSWRTAVLSSFSGGKTSDPFLDVSAGKAAGTGEPGPVAQTITTTAADDLAVIGVSDFTGDGTAVGSSGYTEAVDFSETTIFYKVWTSSGSTGNITLTDGQNGSWTTYHQAFFIASGGIDLVVADASCTSQADAPTLTQVHVLSVADASSTTQADAIELSVGTVTLVVADGFCTTQADAPTLTQAHNLIVADGSSTSQADAPTLTQVHVLVVADTSSTTQADAPTLIHLTVIRPASDAYAGAWTNDVGGTTNLYQSVDETSANDADYIHSEGSPVSSPVVIALGSAFDPVSSVNHTLRYRYGLEGSGTINLTVQLRQSYVNEGSPGTLIKEWTHNGIGSLTTAEQTLSGAEADSITNYSALFVRMVASV